MATYLGDNGDNIFEFYQIDPAELRWLPAPGDVIDGQDGIDTIKLIEVPGGGYYDFTGVTLQSVERIEIHAPTAAYQYLTLPEQIVTQALALVLDFSNSAAFTQINLTVSGDGTHRVPDFEIVAPQDGKGVTLTMRLTNSDGATLQAAELAGVYQSLTGAMGDDTLIGSSGDETLIGAYGADYMAGAGGNDEYSVIDAGDVVFEAPDEGFDTVRAYIDYTLTDNVEVLWAGGRVGRGNQQDNYIFANHGAHPETAFYLSGEGGKDHIVGGNNADRLIGGSQKDKLFGGSGNDQLLGGPGADRLLGQSGDDALLGGSGRDRLDGGGGQDTLTGGAGGDLFVFSGAAVSGLTAATADRITDFDALEGDRIDLREIDAVATSAGDDAFTFIRGKGFSGTAGELRIAKKVDHALVIGDVDGDGAADFVIRVDGPDMLSAADFLL